MKSQKKNTYQQLGKFPFHVLSLLIHEHPWNCQYAII